MNQDNTPGDHVEANQWETMMGGWRTLLAWEIVATVLTVVMARQHLALAIAVAFVDLAAVAQTQPVAQAGSAGSEGDPRRRASVTTGWAPLHSSFLSARA